MTKRKDRNGALAKRMRPGEYGPPRPRAWWEARFIPHPMRTETACEVCDKPMWLPTSKVGLHLTCGDACGRERSGAAKEARKRACETCSRAFIPRTTQLRAGGGRFCSHACSPSEHLTSPDNLARAADGMRKAIAEGRIKHPTGSDHHSWKGGRRAMMDRQVTSGRKAAYTRAWRKANPDRVKEQQQRRSQGKLARLPYGTVPAIRKAQRDKCAICRIKLNGKGHLDHVEPIAKGGLHEARNLQLLCAPCNVRKSAKDPMVYMRELGRLL